MRARYDAEFPPFIYAVWGPGRSSNHTGLGGSYRLQDLLIYAVRAFFCLRNEVFRAERLNRFARIGHLSLELFCKINQRAEKGGLDPSWLDFAFLGRPDFPSKDPQTLQNKYFKTSRLKFGAPQKRECFMLIGHLSLSQ